MPFEGPSCRSLSLGLPEKAKEFLPDVMEFAGFPA